MSEATHYDPYALDPGDIQEPPPTLGLALRKIGPGLILAGSIVGTGELIATTHAGAKAGFVLLWLVMLSCFIKVFVQIELGRYAVSSGKTTLNAFRDLPGPGILLVWWWLIMMLVTQTQLGAMVGGVGEAINVALPGASPWFAERVAGLSPSAAAYLTEHSELPWAALTALGTSVILATGSYRLVERVSTVLVVTFTFMTVVCVLLLPATDFAFGFSELATGFTFQIPAVAVGAAFAMFGITGVGASELISYPYWCIEKGYARNAGRREQSPDWVRRARGWMRVMFADAWVSMIVYTIATVAFFLLGAAVLRAHTQSEGLPGNVQGMLQVLVNMYEPVLGTRAATYFVVVGAFAVLYSTMVSATAANSRALADYLRVNRFVQFSGHVTRLWWIRLFSTVFPIVALILHICMGNPRKMVMIGGIIQAVTLPMIATAAIYLRYCRTDRRITSGWVWDLGLWLSVLGLFLAAIYGVYASKDFLRELNVTTVVVIVLLVGQYLLAFGIGVDAARLRDRGARLSPLLWFCVSLVGSLIGVLAYLALRRWLWLSQTGSAVVPSSEARGQT